MKRYLLKSFLGMILTLFITITLTFFIVRAAPGGPFDRERVLPPAVQANIEAKYHLNDPLIKQYIDYMTDIIFRFDLGDSFTYNDHDVNYYIATSLPHSMLLGFISLTLATVMGVGVGIISALKQNRWPDYTAMSVAVIGISVPLFVIGPLLMYVLALKLKWLPTSGWINGRNGWVTLIMPVITLSFPYFARIARLGRASVLEVLKSDYIRTARAKGLSSAVIVFKHVLKGSLLPVVSYLGPAFAAIMTGSVVVEQIFRVPGMGTYFVKSALNRDYTLLMGAMIVYSIILIVMNFLVDVLYSVLDPRVSYE
ncbi:MAG: ABC transporter permease subunit [Spirochaetales bacterium]|nr:ABC transporter permease subunit [Spirochaetales bacterium]